MAVGLDQDTESLQRGSIPSGGAGTLSVTHEGSGQPWLTVQSVAAIPLKAPLRAGFLDFDVKAEGRALAGFVVSETESGLVLKGIWSAEQSLLRWYPGCEDEVTLISHSGPHRFPELQPRELSYIW